MAETILCAVDDSDAAGMVFDTARGLADAWGAAVVVVHAVGGDSGSADEQGDAVRARLGEAREVPVLRLVEGPPARAIMDAAEQEGAELIVIGSRGRGPLRAAMLGSVSRELASSAPSPVVIVPAAANGAATDSGPGASVVCGVDGSEQALAAAKLAGRLATRLGCRLVVVHARQNLRAVAAYPGASSATPPVTGQEDAVREQSDEVVKKAQAAAGVDAVGVVEPGPPAEVLESVANRENARLIVIASRGVGGLRAAVLGSVAAELPMEAVRPVVVLSRPAAAAAARSAP